jgi:hypothetical protein
VAISVSSEDATQDAQHRLEVARAAGGVHLLLVGVPQVARDVRQTFRRRSTSW